MKNFNRIVLMIALQFVGFSLVVGANEGSNQAEDYLFFDQVGSCLERDGAYLTAEPNDIEGDQLLSNCILEGQSTLTVDIPSLEDLMNFFGQCFDSNGDNISFPLSGVDLSAMFKSCYDNRSEEHHDQDQGHGGGDEQAVNFLHQVGSCLANAGSYLTGEPSEVEGDELLSTCVEGNYHIIAEDAPAKENLYDFFGQCFDTKGDEIQFPLQGEQLGSTFEGCYQEMRANEENNS